MGCVSSSRERNSSTAAACTTSPARPSTSSLKLGSSSAAAAGDTKPSTSPVVNTASTEHLDVLTSVTTPPHEFLSDTEKSIILSDWQRLRHASHQEIGMRIFLRIFQLEPSAKQSFKAFCHLEGPELLQNAMFRCHAVRFMRAVAVAIDNLDALDVIVIPTLVQLGRIHRTVPGLGQKHLDAFECAMAEIWETELCGSQQQGRVGVSGGGYNEESEVAWGKVFRLITSKVHDGYQMSCECNIINSKSAAESPTAVHVGGD